MNTNPWTMYADLEQQVESLRRVVAFDAANGEAFGTRMAELIIIIGAEIDTNLRIFCGGSPNLGMKQYRQRIIERMPKVCEVPLATEVAKRNMRGIFFNPMAELHQPVTHFEWWTAYNKIKHNRYENERLATLRTTITALGALYLTNLIATSCDWFAFQDHLPFKLFKPVFPLVKPQVGWKPEGNGMLASLMLPPTYMPHPDYFTPEGKGIETFWQGFSTFSISEEASEGAAE